MESKLFRKPWLIFILLLATVCSTHIAQPQQSSLVEIPQQVIPTNVPFQPQIVKPVEIEIKKSSEAERIPGCKDLCGDGVCQEIVCMAIGCPCPETPETCPEDCKQPIGTAFPTVVAFPTTAKVEINLTKEDPISVNEVPVKFKGLENETPKIYVEVETETPGKLTAITIQIDKENKLIRIEHENTTAITKESIKVEEKEIKVETPKGDVQVSVLPAKATQVAISKVQQKIKKTELKVLGERVVYEVAGEKSAKLLWLIPVTLPVKTTIDAQTGIVISVEKPWWSFLTA